MNSEVFDWTGRIRRHLAAVLAHELDMTDVSGADAARAVEEYAEIERYAAMAKVRAARRVAETQAYKRSGDKDAAGWFARTTGSSKRDAGRSLAAAKSLDDLPATRAAAERGELSEQQLREITDAATANPAAEQELLDAARTDTMAGLKDKALKAKGSAGDRRTRHERIRLSRYVRHGVDAEGAFWMNVRNTADVGAAMVAALRPFEDAVFERNRGRDVREQREAYAADALAGALCGPPDTPDTPVAGDQPVPAPTRRRSRDVKVIVRVDLAALRRGHTQPGELAEIAGLGHVPVSTIRAMFHDAFLATVLTDGVDVRTVTHHGRRPNAFQQTVLELTHPACDVEGCSRQWFLEADHRIDWSKVQLTDLTNLDRLCEHHHDLKTHHGWRLAPGTGKRPFLAPGQPLDARGPAGTTTRSRGRPTTTAKRRTGRSTSPSRAP